MLPHDQKLGIKGDNSQTFLIIPSEILKAVHQEILSSLVNVNRHENSETDPAMQLNTSLIFVALETWLSTLPAQILKTCPMSLRAFLLTSGVLAFQLFLSATAISQASFLFVILYSC